jgi:hypothetical protein
LDGKSKRRREVLQKTELSRLAGHDRGLERGIPNRATLAVTTYSARPINYVSVVNHLN